MPKNKSSTAHLVRTLFNVVECLVQWESQDTAQKHWFLPQKKQRTRGKQPSKNIYIFIIFTTFQQSLQHCFERQVPKQTTSFRFGSDYSSHFSMQPIYALKSPPRTISWDQIEIGFPCSSFSDVFLVKPIGCSTIYRKDNTSNLKRATQQITFCSNNESIIPTNPPHTHTLTAAAFTQRRSGAHGSTSECASITGTQPLWRKGWDGALWRGERLRVSQRGGGKKWCWYTRGARHRLSLPGTKRPALFVTHSLQFRRKKRKVNL